MDYINSDIVTRKETIQKPRGNTFTLLFRITVSISVDAMHVPQCKNQIKDPTKTSFSLDVITHQSDDLHMLMYHMEGTHGVHWHCSRTSGLPLEVLLLHPL